MASRERSRRSVKMSRVEAKEKLVNRLRENQDEAIRKYQEEVAAYEAEQARAEQTSNVTSTEGVELGDVPNTTEQPTKLNNNNEKKLEVNIMAKQLDFNMDDATQETKLGDINAKVDDDIDMSNIPDMSEGAKTEPAGEESNKSGRATKPTITADTITDAARESRLLDDQNAYADVVRLLHENVLLKQFITGTDFGRGFVLSTTKGDEKDGQAIRYIGEFRVENLKPGRAKAAIVAMPRALSNVFEAKSTSSVQGLKRELLNLVKNGGITPEQKADMVDVAMNYNDFAARVAQLMEGEIAEFGGVNGELNVGLVSYRTQNNSETGTSEFALNNKIEANIATIGTDKFNMYGMSGVRKELLLKAAQGEPLSKDDKKKIQRYKDGKSPLKRTVGAYSPLYTEKNFTPMAKFVTVAPFVGTLAQADAERLSAKAEFQKRNNKHMGAGVVTLRSYDEQQFKGDSKVAAIFDPSISAEERFKLLTVAENFTELDAYGNVKKRKVLKKNEDGTVVKDANNKNVYEEVEVKTATRKLTARVPRDFFTGKPYDASEMANVQFVKYGVETQSSKGGAVAPKTQKTALSFESKEVTVDDKRGIVGTYGLDDAALGNLKTLGVDEAVIKDAFIKASVRKQSPKAVSPAGDLEAGTLLSILSGVDTSDAE